MSGFQPEEFKEAVRALWREGLTSGQIADAKGVTRNIVIGVLQLLGEDRRTQGRGATAKALPKPKLASVSRRVTHNPPSVTPTVSAEPRPISLPVLKATLTPDQRIEAPSPLLNKPVTAVPARPPMRAALVADARRVAAISWLNFKPEPDDLYAHMRSAPPYVRSVE